MANVVIVGGGITGLFAALLLDSQGHDVTIIERAEKPGGLLRSIRNPEGVCFDYGCHFIKDSGVPEVDAIAYDFDPNEWHVYDHNLSVGNYFAGQLNTKSSFIQSQALPRETYERGVLDFMALDPNVHNAPPVTLEDYYVNKFGRTFTDHIFDPVTKKVYGCESAELTPTAHMFLSAVRLLAFTPETTKELKKAPFYDARLAFHDASRDGYGGLKNYYPREGGIETWVDYFLEKIARTNIQVITNDGVAAMNIPGDRVQGVELASGRTLDCDELVWTVPIVGFLKASRTEFRAQRPSMVNVALFNYVFDRPFDTDLYYITNYDPECQMYRVTFYPNIVRGNGLQAEPYNCTVEIFAPQAVDTETAVYTLPDELRAMGVLPGDASVVAQHVLDLKGLVPAPTRQYAQDFDNMRTLANERAQNVMFLGLANGHFLQNDALVHAYNEISARA